MAGITAFVIAAPVTTVTAGRIEFPFYLVDGHVVAAVRHFPVGAVAVLGRRLHFRVVGVAVGAERGLVTGGTETVVLRSVEAMIFYEYRGVVKGFSRFHGPFLLIFMTFAAGDLLAGGNRFGMGAVAVRRCFHAGTRGEQGEEAGKEQGDGGKMESFHFFPPIES